MDNTIQQIDLASCKEGFEMTVVAALTDLELAMVGGGCGEVVFG